MAIRLDYYLRRRGGPGPSEHDATVIVEDGTITRPMLASDAVATGTPDGTKFLRDDQTWQTVPSGVATATTTTAGKAKVDHDSAGDPVALTQAGHESAADPHAQYALDSEKAAANGIATLDAGGKHPAGQIPFGSSGTTVCVGNDARLSDARVPTAHDILTSHNGFPGGATNFLREDGTWQAAGGSTPVATTITQGKSKVDHDSAGDPVALTSAGHGAAADPHVQYQLESEKGAASGYASLDAGTKVPIAQVPTGTTSTTVCIGNDARLSDARTPTAHATSHKSGGSDAVKLDELAAPTDVATLNVSLTAHGLVPKLPGGTSTFFRADGSYAAPGGGNDARIITKELTADQTVSSTTMAKVTGLDQNVDPGTWWFEYRIIWQTTATGTAIKLGVNFSGTQTRFVVEATGAEATTAASTGAMDQVHAAFGLRSGGGNRAPSTTVSIFGPTAADTAGADMLAIIKGVIVVTVAGNLELYFGSEATGSTQTCESGTALQLTKVSA